uniref:Uncharacterized protein n=1 Tax=Oryza meridionalis TaxID=40149 RepID=A0A0E0E1U9_9ORYZ
MGFYRGTSEVSKEQEVSKISKGSTSAPELAKRKITTIAGQDKAPIESYNKKILILVFLDFPCIS